MSRQRSKYLNRWAHLIAVVDVARVRRVHWPRPFIMTPCEAALHRPPHALCPALVQKLAPPRSKHVSVVQETFQILHTHTENILIPDRLFHFVSVMDFMTLQTSTHTLMNPFSVSSSGCVMASASCRSERNWSCNRVACCFFQKEKEENLSVDVSVLPVVVLLSGERVCVPHQPLFRGV